MVESSPASVLIFDLRATRDYPLARNARIGRWLTLGVFVTVFGSTLYLSAFLTEEGAWTLTALIALVFLIWICGASLYIAIGFAPQAEVLELAEQGFVLKYPSGRAQAIRWEDKNLTLKLARNEPSGHAKRPVPSTWVLLGNRPFQNYLTRAAFDGLIGQARARGLNIDERPARRPGWTRIIIASQHFKGFG